VKTRPFLRDVDDPALFSQMLENVYLLLYEELGDTLAQFPLVRCVSDESYLGSSPLLGGNDLARTYEDLARMRHTMSLLIRDMAERKARLANRAVGLSDVEFEKD